MELDEIKTIWTEMNSRLEKTEAVNKQLLENLINSKHQSAKDKLMKYERLYLVLTFAMIPVFSSQIFIKTILPETMVLTFDTVMLMAGIWQMYKIRLLNQMDIHRCSTSELLAKAHRFKVITRMRTIIGMTLLVPVAVIIYRTGKDILPVEACYAMGIGVVAGAVIGLTHFFKHMKNIEGLVKNYKEILELKKDIE